MVGSRRIVRRSSLAAARSGGQVSIGGLRSGGLHEPAL
jgi:hypothetical protein